MRARLHRLALVFGLASLLAPRPTALAQAGTGPLAWTYEVVNHQPSISPTDSGCSPSIRPVGLEFDAGGRPIVGWHELPGCGIPFPDPEWTDFGPRIAVRTAGAWQERVLDNILCGLGSCAQIYRTAAFALRADGHPFLVFSGPGEDAYHLRSVDMFVGQAWSMDALGPYNSTPAFPLIAADFAPDSLSLFPGRLSVPDLGGPLRLNGSEVASVAAPSWIDYAAGAGGAHHLALHAGGPNGYKLYYSTGAGLTMVLDTAAFDSTGGAIALAPSGRRHIVNAGGPTGAANALVHLSSDDGIAWAMEQVDIDASLPEVAVDAAGDPAIVYWKNNSRELWLARRIGPDNWRKSLVAVTPGLHGSYAPRLAFDAAGNPHVFYYNNVTHDLVLASGSAATVNGGLLTVSRMGFGSGVVTSTDSGILCGDTCTTSTPMGTTVLLTATPLHGAVFAGWTGACTGRGPCVVTVAGAVSVGAAFHAPRPGATIVVGDGCSLSQAIQAANLDATVGGCAAGSGADTVLLPQGTYTFTEPFAGNPAFDGNLTALPLIESEMTIAGEGAGVTTLERADGSPDFRFLTVRPPMGNLTVRDLTFRGGRSGSVSGGAIHNSGSLTVERAVFDGNQSGDTGGAIYGFGHTTIRSSLFANNRAVRGGAVYNHTGTTETSEFRNNVASYGGGGLYVQEGVVTGSSFVQNEATSFGGGLAAGVSATGVELTVTGNRAAEGGGIQGGASLTLINSRVIGNTATGHGGGVAEPASPGARLTLVGTTVAANSAAGNGGGVYATANLNATNSTISGNTAGGVAGGVMVGNGPASFQNATITANHAGHLGGGMYYVPWVTPITIANSILGGNTGGNGYADCYSPEALVSRGHNILGDNSGCAFASAIGDQIGNASAPIDLRLAPLADNGGFAPTHEPLADSPAVDAGSGEQPGSSTSACAPGDQRGLERPQRVGCDIGAVERANRPPVVSALSLTVAEDDSVLVQVDGVDAEGDAFTISVLSQPAHGTVIGAPPSLTYVPSPDFFGVDAFTVQAADAYGATAEAVVDVTVTPVNDPPGAVDDAATVIANSQPVFIAVLDNDTSEPDDPEALQVIAVTAPGRGTASVAASGLGVEYTPNPDTGGADQFTYTISDGNGGEATATVNVSITGSADIRVEIDAPDAVIIGEPVTWRLIVHNDGIIGATNVAASLAFSVPMDFRSAGCSRTGEVVHCVIDELAPEASRVIEVVAAPLQLTPLTLTASAHTTVEPDPRPANNTATVTVPIDTAVDLDVVTFAAEGTPREDQPFDLHLVVTNRSGATATGSSLMVALPAGTAVEGMSPGCSLVPLGIQCAIEPLAANHSAAILATVIPSVGGTFVATATVTSGQPDSDPGNNVETLTIEVAHAPVIIEVIEAITVSEMAGLPPLRITEAITVRDRMSDPLAQLAVAETITVNDGVSAPLAAIAVAEAIAVNDGVSAPPLAVAETIVVSDQVGAEQVNTPTGSNVVVTPIDNTGQASVTLTFSNVTVGGSSTVERLSSGPPAPAGFRLGSPPVYFEVATTAQFSGAISICINYAGITFATVPRLLHFESGAWVHLIASVDPGTQTICGLTTSLSPFALVEPDNPSTPGEMRGDGHIRDDGDKYRFDFIVRETERRGERGRIRVVVEHAAQMVRDSRGRTKKVTPRDDEFVARDIDFVAFSDDPSFRPGRRHRPQVDTVRFAGTGQWNGEDGYRFEVTAADEGEPGRHRESISITIVSPQGVTVARVSGEISGGNIQSRRIRH